MDKLVCENCGSSDIEVMAWIKVNGDNILSYETYQDEQDDRWCCKCEEHVKFMTEQEFKNKPKTTTCV